MPNLAINFFTVYTVFPIFLKNLCGYIDIDISIDNFLTSSSFTNMCLSKVVTKISNNWGTLTLKASEER